EWEIHAIKSSDIHLNLDSDVLGISIKVDEVNSRFIHLQLILRFNVNRKLLPYNVAGAIENDAGLHADKLAHFIDFGMEKCLIDISFDSEIQVRGVARTFKVSFA